MTTKPDLSSTILKQNGAVDRGPRHMMDRKGLAALNDNFKAFIMPLLNEDDPEDYHLIWEFHKLFHEKRLRVLASESEGTKKWKEFLQSR